MRCIGHAAIIARTNDVVCVNIKAGSRPHFIAAEQMMETPNGSDRPITLKDLTEAEARIEDRIIKRVVGAMDERLEISPACSCSLA